MIEAQTRRKGACELRLMFHSDKHEHNTVQFQNILKKTGHILKVKNQNSIKLNSNTETGRIMEQSLQYSEGNLNNKVV